MSDLLLYKRGRQLRRGVTLVELLVVLAIMTVMAAVVGLAAPIHRTDPDVATTRVTAARRAALSAGRPVSITVISQERPYAVTAYPDGAVVADSTLAVDRLAGVPEPRFVAARTPRAP